MCRRVLLATALALLAFGGMAQAHTRRLDGGKARLVVGRWALHDARISGYTRAEIYKAQRRSPVVIDYQVLEVAPATPAPGTPVITVIGGSDGELYDVWVNIRVRLADHRMRISMR